MNYIRFFINCLILQNPNTVSSKSLQEVRDALLLQATDNEVAPVPLHRHETQEKNNKQSYHQLDHKNFLPTDPHLERLRKLTSRLIEEKMLSELKVDAIRASSCSYGTMYYLSSEQGSGLRG